MAKEKNKGHGTGKKKSFAAKRTMNPPGPGKAGQAQNLPPGDSFQQQDADRRLGSFEGRGEHARTGNPGHS